MGLMQVDNDATFVPLYPLEQPHASRYGTAPSDCEEASKFVGFPGRPLGLRYNRRLGPATESADLDTIPARRKSVTVASATEQAITRYEQRRPQATILRRWVERSFPAAPPGCSCSSPYDTAELDPSFSPRQEAMAWVYLDFCAWHGLYHFRLEQHFDRGIPDAHGTWTLVAWDMYAKLNPVFGRTIRNFQSPLDNWFVMPKRRLRTPSPDVILTDPETGRPAVAMAFGIWCPCAMQSFMEACARLNVLHLIL
jgi:hypothetical protein